MATLEYKSPEPTLKSITLEQSGGEVCLIFPPPPSWTTWIGVIVASVAGGIGILAVSFFIMIAVKWGIPLTAYRWILLLHSITAAGYFVSIVYTIAHFRRWGRTPSILRVTNEELIWSKPGLWWMRQQRCAATELESVDVLPVSDIFGRQTRFKLRFRRKNGRAIMRYFSTRDPDLPARIVRAFREVLHFPP